MSERAHKPFGASAADANALCPGGWRQRQRVPNIDSPYSIEGTKAHTVLDHALKNGMRDAATAHADSELWADDLDDGRNGFYRSIDIALTYVYELLDGNPDAVMYNEVRVDPPLPASPGDAAGYCDIGIFLPSARMLYVIDYKHGAGVAKDVNTTRQPKQYAAGFLFEENARIDPDDVDVVVLVMLQPRVYNKTGLFFQELPLPTYEVYDYLDEMNDIVTACLDPNAPLVPGDEQCRFCSAAAVCPAREALALGSAIQGYKQIGDLPNAVLPEPQELGLDRLALILQHAGTLKSWLKKCEEYAFSLAMEGHPPPGKKLVEAKAKREWFGHTDEIVEQLTTLGGLDIEDVYPRQLVPITEAQKLFVDAYRKAAPKGKKTKAAQDANEAFALLTLKKTSGSLSLADISDARPAVNRAANTFSQLGQVALPAPTVK